MSEHFCGSCNRLRLTADGNLKVMKKKGEKGGRLAELAGERECRATCVWPRGNGALGKGKIMGPESVVR
jgi:hypothetical protein